MKRFSIGVMIVAMMFLATPTPARAVTISELQALIASLTAQLNSLIALQNGSGGTTSVVNPTGTSTGLIVFSEKPTLKLVYDRNKSESSLEGAAVATVQAGANDVLLAYAQLRLTNQNGGYAPTKMSSMDIMSGATVENVTTADGYTYKAYRVRANTKASFKLSLTANPQVMFAGSYVVSLAEPATVDNGGYYQSGTLAYDDTRSLPVTIIGEKSPYISGFEFKGMYVILSGARFSKGDKVYVNGVKKGVITDFKGDNALLPVSWLPTVNDINKYCYVGGAIQIENSKTGKSNNFWVSKECEYSGVKLSAQSMELIGVSLGSNTFQANKPIKFSVKGISSDGKQASPSKGFHVQSWIGSSKGEPVTVDGVVQSVNAEFNYSTGYWDVTLMAPSNSPITYTVDTAFYCSMPSAGCVDRSQINQAFNFNIGDPTNLTPSIKITSPNGGNYYPNDGSPLKVTWSTNNVPSNFTFDLIRLRGNNGETVLAKNVVNDGEETVYINGIPAGEYTLEMKAYLNGTLVMDASDSNFKIIGSVSSKPVINSISPTQGVSGTMIKVYGTGFTTQSIVLIGDNVESLTPMDISAYGDWLTFPFPASALEKIPSANTFSVRISNVGNVSVASGLASNSATFYVTKPPVTTPSITLLSPNGGENWLVGSTQNITWKTNSISTPNDKITLYLIPAGDPSRNRNLVQSIPNTGSFNYVVDDPARFSSLSPFYKAGEKFKIFVCAASVESSSLCATAIDYGDDSFTINYPSSTTTTSSVSGVTQSNQLNMIAGTLQAIMQMLKGM